ncbi:MAG: flavin reductase family protein [DPANN group archaeon]|nr:flavin reductase family protein [DPANN group archaeon]
MEIHELKNFYKLMSPKLTVLVTTMDRSGKVDVSPFSFVTPLSFDPPLLGISVGPNKHSYWSITQKKEFVVHVPTEELVEKIVIAGQNWDPETSKLERAGLETIPGTKVGPPILKDCPVSIECYLEDTKKVGDHVLIIGRVVAINVKDEGMLDDEGRLKVDLVRPPLHVSENVFAFPYVTKNIGE